MRKQKITYHMLGILHILQDGAVSPRGMVYSALVVLAMHGYVKVGKKATLTAKGRQLAFLHSAYLSYR